MGSIIGTPNEQFAERLIMGHVKERNWEGVKEDLDWLGRKLLEENSPRHLFHFRDPGNPDVLMLVTVYYDGTGTVAYSDGEGWGPEHSMEPREAQ